MKTYRISDTLIFCEYNLKEIEGFSQYEDIIIQYICSLENDYDYSLKKIAEKVHWIFENKESIFAYAANSGAFETCVNLSICPTKEQFMNSLSIKDICIYEYDRLFTVLVDNDAVMLGHCVEVTYNYNYQYDCVFYS